MTHTAQPQHRTPNPSPRLTFWTSATGIICLLLIAGTTLAAIALIGRALTTPASEQLQVQVTDCHSTSAVSMATISLTVTNTGTTPRPARIGIEYRDATGALLDTDTARIPTIAPGDTARHTESTFLSGRPQGKVSCGAVSVR